MPASGDRFAESQRSQPTSERPGTTATYRRDTVFYVLEDSGAYTVAGAFCTALLMKQLSAV